MNTNRGKQSSKPCPLAMSFTGVMKSERAAWLHCIKAKEASGTTSTATGMASVASHTCEFCNQSKLIRYLV